ncbi:MAG: DUF418 domain-containing protein [Gammaproteobacteria bacterium]
MQEHPVSAAQQASRIVQLDVLRGFAVLGIYWINILIFALPYHSYTLPTVSGTADQANITAWAISEIFFDGAMRGLFSLLFGASAMLFLDERRHSGTDLEIVDRYYRRTLLLLLFGLVHAYVLLWPYDVLYAYGLLGLFLFPLRKLSTPLLIVLAAGLLLIGEMDNRHFGEDDPTEEQIAHASLRDTLQALQKHQPPSPSQYDNREVNNIIDHEDVELYRSSYQRIFTAQFNLVVEQHSTSMYTSHVFDIGGMMLIGMVLLRMGILSGQRSRRYYLVLLLGGYGLGIVLRGITVYISILNDFNAMLITKDVDLNYQLGRLPIVLGHIGLIGLLCKYSVFFWLQDKLAAVGRLALTHYIMQTLISLFIFYGFGLGLYARLERYELVFICLAVWAVQILFSVLWLHQFRLGPLEWLWRSMIYARRQALRKKTASDH